MLPMPETSALVQQRPLDAGTACLEPRHDAGPVVARLERVGGDVGDARGHTPATGALGDGDGHVGDEVGERHPPEGPLVDEPQLGPVVREVEPGVQVLLRRGVGRARPAAGRSCPGGRSGPAGGRRGPPARARGTCRGARRQGRRCRSAGRRGRPVRGRDGGRPGCRGTAPRRSAVRRRGPAGRAGRPRPRGAQASARSGASTPGGVGSTGAPRTALARRVELGPRDLGGLLLGLLLAATDPLAEHLVADDRARR